MTNAKMSPLLMTELYAYANKYNDLSKGADNVIVLRLG